MMKFVAARVSREEVPTSGAGLREVEKRHEMACIVLERYLSDSLKGGEIDVGDLARQVWDVVDAVMQESVNRLVSVAEIKFQEAEEGDLL